MTFDPVEDAAVKIDVVLVAYFEENIEAFDAFVSDWFEPTTTARSGRPIAAQYVNRKKIEDSWMEYIRIRSPGCVRPNHRDIPWLCWKWLKYKQKSVRSLVGFTSC